MNAEQKKIALECIRLWGSEDLSDCAGDQMAALLQELIDAPETEPFGYFRSEPFGWTDCAETDDGSIALYTAPPAPSVTDEQLQAAFDRGLKAGNEQGIAQHNEIHKLLQLYDLLSAALTPAEAPADVARDAALYCAVQRVCAELPEGWEIRIELERSAGTVSLVNPDGEYVDYPSDHEYMASDINDAIDAAIEREILGGTEK